MDVSGGECGGVAGGNAVSSPPSGSGDGGLPAAAVFQYGSGLPPVATAHHHHHHPHPHHHQQQLAHQLSSSSAHNSDEDEDEDSDTASTRTYMSAREKQDKRREQHTLAEQRRRDLIKKGYDVLSEIVPTCQPPGPPGTPGSPGLLGQDDTTLGGPGAAASKLSKASILNKSIEYMRFLNAQKRKQQEELDDLRKDVIALRIMHANYEQIVQAYQYQNPEPARQLTDGNKFQVFSALMDELFKSFNNSVSVSSFAELSGSVIHWQEEYCKPHTLREMCLSVLREINKELQQPHAAAPASAVGGQIIGKR